MRVAIIPARGGSKRIPGKNIRDFCGQPIIAYSIQAAVNSGLFERVIVSTDCEKIAAISKAFGAEVPFLRPAHLADDHTGVVAVLKQVLQQLEDQGIKPEHSCGIYATAPLLEAEDLCQSFQALDASDADSVMAVTDFAFPIQRAIRLDEGKLISPFDQASMAKRSQDLEPAYHDAAQFFWWKTSYLNKPQPQVMAYPLPRSQVQDIDTEEDWLIAEQLYRLKQATSVDQQVSRAAPLASQNMEGV